MDISTECQRRPRPAQPAQPLAELRLEGVAEVGGGGVGDEVRLWPWAVKSLPRTPAYFLYKLTTELYNAVHE